MQINAIMNVAATVKASISIPAISKTAIPITFRSKNIRSHDYVLDLKV